ncbi:DUF1737 domain-containing protein [Pseudomonas helvetica]|uniref:DUF1737 domain-containing protein n=1 Tax=Pseudomonas helvetica TaxID=3136738 RepID=UPI0032670E9D
MDQDRRLQRLSVWFTLRCCLRRDSGLALGYQLYGSPAATFNGSHIVVAQAVIWSQSK